MTKRFEDDQKATYIALQSSGDNSDDRIILFSVRKAIVFNATGRSICLRDAATDDLIGRGLPQKVCAEPEDAAKEKFLFAVFDALPPKDALDMARDLGEHWKALNIDSMCDQIASVERKAEQQFNEHFRDAHRQRVESMQTQLEEFRLRGVEAISFKQVAQVRHKAAGMFARG